MSSRSTFNAEYYSSTVIVIVIVGVYFEWSPFHPVMLLRGSRNCDGTPTTIEGESTRMPTLKSTLTVFPLLVAEQELIFRFST
jgi:hypothetical protein